MSPAGGVLEKHQGNKPGCTGEYLTSTSDDMKKA